MLVEKSRDRRGPRGAQLRNLSTTMSVPPGAADCSVRVVQLAAENVQPSTGRQWFKGAGWSWGRAPGGGRKRWGRGLRWIPRICTHRLLLPFSEPASHLSAWSLLQPGGLRGDGKVRQGMETLLLVTQALRKLIHGFGMGTSRSFTQTAQGKATVAIWITCNNGQ